MIKQSTEITLFCRAYLHWVQSGAKNSDMFYRKAALCSAFMSFVWAQSKGKMDIDRRVDLSVELKKLFRADGLDSLYPFGADEFEKQYDDGTFHECPKRLAWVNQHALLDL